MHMPSHMHMLSHPCALQRAEPRDRRSAPRRRWRTGWCRPCSRLPHRTARCQRWQAHRLALPHRRSQAVACESHTSLSSPLNRGQVGHCGQARRRRHVRTRRCRRPPWTRGAARSRRPPWTRAVPRAPASSTHEPQLSSGWDLREIGISSNGWRADGHSRLTTGCWSASRRRWASPPPHWRAAFSQALQRRWPTPAPVHLVLAPTRPTGLPTVAARCAARQLPLVSFGAWMRCYRRLSGRPGSHGGFGGSPGSSSCSAHWAAWRAEQGVGMRWPPCRPVGM